MVCLRSVQTKFSLFLLQTDWIIYDCQWHSSIYTLISFFAFLLFDLGFTFFFFSVIITLLLYRAIVPFSQSISKWKLNSSIVKMIHFDLIIFINKNWKSGNKTNNSGQQICGYAFLVFCVAVGVLFFGARRQSHIDDIWYYYYCRDKTVATL